MSEVEIGWSEGAAEREARVEVVHAAWRSAYADIFSRAEIDGIFDGSLEGQGSWVAARLAPAGTLAARRGRRIIGLAGLGLLRGGDGELAAFYVLPDQQGRGVGTALWERSIAELRLRQCPRMEVWTLARSSARRFYEARGCVAFGEGSFEVAGHREPAVGYALDISAAPASARWESISTR
ncbi:MAG TPA: GNAT family N-acetyltransferase [Candidatus Dormibacteraeota bacterium]|nr:GNAT family N-acetyltransferase [Candidatus Dormibacteraeota bacterium]